MPFGLKFCGMRNPETRRMLKRFWAFYLVMFMFYGVEHSTLSSRSHLWWFVAAIGFTGAFAAALWTFGLMAYRQKDEFHKVLLAQATMWSAFVTMTAALIWGFLETSGKVPLVPLLVVPFAFMMLTALIFGALRIQNRVVSE